MADRIWATVEQLGKQAEFLTRLNQRRGNWAPPTALRVQVRVSVIGERNNHHNEAAQENQENFPIEDSSLKIRLSTRHS